MNLTEWAVGYELDAQVAEKVMGWEPAGVATIYRYGDSSHFGRDDDWSLSARNPPAYYAGEGVEVMHATVFKMEYLARYKTLEEMLPDTLATVRVCKERFGWTEEQQLKYLADFTRDFVGGVHEMALRTADLYSANIATAWLVVERMKAQGWATAIDVEVLESEEPYTVTMHRGGGRDAEGSADTIALAICRAALAAVSLP